MRVIGVTVIFIASFILFPSVVIADSNSEYTWKIDTSPGDYFEYTLDLTGYVQTMIDEDEDLGIVDVEINSKSGWRTFYPDVSCVELTGHCVRSVQSYDYNLTIILEEGSGLDNDRVVTSSSFQTVRESTPWKSWSESTATVHMWVVQDGVSSHFEGAVVTEIRATTDDTSPTKVSVGDSWSITDESSVIITERDRVDGGEWEVEITEESWENTTNFNAESSGSVMVNGVSFDSIKILYQEVGSSEKKFVHKSNGGIPVKMEYYDGEGSLTMMMTLSDYEFANEPSEGFLDSLPGFEMTAIMSMLALAAFYNRYGNN